jgi:hypothetical protein
LLKNNFAYNFTGNFFIILAIKRRVHPVGILLKLMERTANRNMN